MIASDWRARIICDPDLHNGEPCIKGTRIPVAVIVATLADMDRDALIRQYPQLSVADVQAALRNAAEAA
ncbi:MAG: DUF433 domain-containing protein [Phycisphaeraceae bacterium]|nr:DUF433 domain-containing protein [Phycisphaeraceae bacterium]